MPRTATEAKPAPETFFSPQSLARQRPMIFAALAMAAYLTLSLPILARRHFDPAVFVNAGDRYVNAAQADPPLPVKAHSDGYDGQFYYRMAQHPFSLDRTEGGITFDHPAKRLERFLYPLLAWAVSGGDLAGAAWALFGINLMGLGAIALLACRLARQCALPAILPVAVMLWPGFIVTLMHDTTEIVSTAFLLGALWCYLGDRLVLYAVLATAATLARETTVPVFVGVIGYEALAAWRAGGPWRRVFFCGAALVPFGLWREALAVLAHEAAQAQQVAHDLDWPFFGVAGMLWACITGSRPWASTPLRDAIIRAIVLLTAPPLFAWCAFVALRLKPAFSHGKWAGIAAGWVLTAALMSLLSAGGPLIDPLAYFRAFTDCYVVGCLLLFAVAFRPRPLLVAVLGGTELLLIWGLCLTKLR